jgi:hypothetical protein
MVKKCTKCGIEKENECFGKDKRLKSGLCSDCKECRKKYYLENKDRFEKHNKKYMKKYYDKNKEILLKKNKKWVEENKEYRKEYCKNYNKENEEKIKKNFKNYYWENRDYFLRKNKEWREDNDRREYKNNWSRERRKNDTNFKLRDSISSQIRKLLKKQGMNKASRSILDFLPFTIQELKKHLESQFEDWMDWENHGNYDKNRKTWQVDHIIPQSHLIYDSMEHPNFKKCWSLENLQPLETIKNLKKGDRNA